MLAWSTNRVSSANHRSFTNVHAFSLTEGEGVDFASFGVGTIIVASTFLGWCTHPASAFVEAWTVVVLVTFWNTFVVDTYLAG